MPSLEILLKDIVLLWCTQVSLSVIFICLLYFTEKNTHTHKRKKEAQEPTQKNTKTQKTHKKQTKQQQKNPRPVVFWDNFEMQFWRLYVIQYASCKIGWL